MDIPHTPSFSLLDAASDACLLAWTPAALPDPLTLAWEGRYVIAPWEDNRGLDCLEALEAALGPRLLAAEPWWEILPRAGVLIDATLSGGTLRQRLSEAARQSPGRCWLRLERLRMVFPLPCPTGCGEALTGEALEQLLAGRQSFFSEELCCRYACLPEDGSPQMVLYDTPETLDRKLALARELDFAGAVLFP